MPFALGDGRIYYTSTPIFMSFLDKFLGKNPEPASPAPTPSPEPTPASASVPAPVPPPAEEEQPAMIKVFDNQGRELLVPREEWRDKVLMSSLQQAWNDADQLGPMVVQALRDGFHADVVGAAEQVQRLDPNPARGAVLVSLVYMKNNRLPDAEKVLKDCLAQHGDHGVVFTNLAKVYAAQGDEAKAEETLWRGLQIDPNQDNGVAMYEHLHLQRGGEAAAQEATRRVAALPGSWRAQLSLARQALKAGELDEAQVLQQEALSRCGRPVPPDMLMQISGDLGMNGHLVELVQITEPLFEPAVHGIQVGNNLFRAYLDLGQLDQARDLINKLYAQQRPDWRDALAAWEAQAATAGHAAAPPPGEGKSLRIAILNIEGPVWLNLAAPGAELFEAKEDYSLRIAFLGSSGEAGKPGGAQAERQLSDGAGRLSRTMPLYLNEQVHLGTDERAQTLVPWIAEKEAAGFVFSGSPWAPETAVQIASASEQRPDYVVTTHVRAPDDTAWHLDVVLVRVIDGATLGSFSVAMAPDGVEKALPGLVTQLFNLLAEQAEAEIKPFPATYQLPTGTALAHYLLRLEQLLATRCAATDGTPDGFLNGEREIIEGSLALCLDTPASPTLRLLLAQLLLSMKKVRPDILPEFRDRIATLQAEKPLAPPAHGVVQRMIDEALRA